MQDTSGIVFDNRMLQTTLPAQTPQGIVHTAIIPLDFIPISNFGAISTQFNPVWEGIYEGLQVLQLMVGNFGGLERAFATAVSVLDGGIDLWELTDSLRSDFQNPAIGGQDGEARVTWIVETPAWNWSKPMDLKQMVSAELWIDKIFGQVVIKVEWRPDGDPCWKTWAEWIECQPRTSAETLPESVTYPLVQYREGFKATRTLPKPPVSCESNTGRPASVGYQHQLRITVKGWMRLRGLFVLATPVERKLYDQMIGATP
jgi:hypothetical protein